jgi:hypothetical protein
MNELVSHIEFLLHSHLCVIVPHFGGFVLNCIPARKIGLASFAPPEYELLFNQELTHNDGLLTESFMRMHDISFEEANLLIKKQVDELKISLSSGESLFFGDLGSFRINDEGHYVFTPNKFIRPEYFGLSQVSLKPIIEMQPSAPSGRKGTRSKQPTIRHISIASAIATVIAAIIFLITSFDKNIPTSQSANILSESVLFMNNSAKTFGEPVSQPVSRNQNSTSSLSNTKPHTTESSANQESTSQVKSETKYYIVLGVYELRSGAEFTEQTLRAEGFSEVYWLERPGRIDLYTAVFTDRREAENYLKTLHKEYPNHSDAWIMKRTH